MENQLSKKSKINLMDYQNQGLTLLGNNLEGKQKDLQSSLLSKILN